MCGEKAAEHRAWRHGAGGNVGDFGRTGGGRMAAQAAANTCARPSRPTSCARALLTCRSARSWNKRARVFRTLRLRRQSRRSAPRPALWMPRAARRSAPVLQRQRCGSLQLQDRVRHLPPTPPLPRVTSPSLSQSNLEHHWLIRGRHSHSHPMVHEFAKFGAAAVYYISDY